MAIPSVLYFNVRDQNLTVLLREFFFPLFHQLIDNFDNLLVISSKGFIVEKFPGRPTEKIRPKNSNIKPL